MKRVLGRFLGDRRGVIAIVFAISLLPLAMLVTLSIDFAFYAQARAEIGLAADAAATHAIRAASETYMSETSGAGISNATAIADAIASGKAAGAAWFWAQLGKLPSASIDSGNPNVVVMSNATISTTNPAGFTASVTYRGSYPPFFGPLFHSKSDWAITGTTGATSTYSYVEILMLLDNSSSMLIGATPADIDELELNTVCIPNSWSGTAANGMSAYDQSNQALDVDMRKVAYYNSGDSSTNIKGKCASGYQGPYSPCGFACHTNNSGRDYYGIARSLGVTLRLDVVLSAAEHVISSMVANEQAPDQFSVGIYQFNSDIAPLFPNAPSQPGNVDEEASPDLSAALAAVDAIDFTKNPQETSEPPVTNYTNPCCQTNFPGAVKGLIAGTYADGQRFGPSLSPAGSGGTMATPQKNIFIVTDGMEDAQVGGNRENGQMTGVAAETDTYSPNPAVCQAFKKLGFTVYVLYVQYNSLPNTYYMTQAVEPTPYFDEDFPELGGKWFATQAYAEATSATQQSGSGGSAVSPDVAAMRACASAPADFFEADNAADIGNAMNAMLKSALSSAIRVTQ